MTKAEFGIVVFSTMAVCALVWDSFGGAFLHRGRNRGEVLALYHAVQPGAKASVVAELSSNARYPHLTFHGDQDRGWYISTPLEFGAKNWVLVIDVGDGRVTSVRIRTEDGLHDHPAQAPADKSLGVSARQEAGQGRAVEQGVAADKAGLRMEPRR